MMTHRETRWPDVRRRAARGWFFLIASVLGTFCSGEAPAQITRGVREYPSNPYYIALKLMDNGDLARAEEGLRNAARSGLRSPEGPWVDAICYHAMMGDCYYQMGDLARALEQYTSALRLYVAQSNWMLRVEFQAVDAQVAPLRSPIAWGVSQRRTAMARLPQRYAILQGNLDLQRTIQQGGVLAPPEYNMINAHEIVRCTARAIRRRADIMGLACRHDPLTEQLIATLSIRPAPPNHWSQAWIDCLLGLAYLSSGRTSEAAAELTKSLQLAGQLDHPLTAEALLVLGRLAFQQQKYDVAATMFLESTFPGAWFEQYDIMAEAFQWGVLTQLVAGRPGLYLPLEPAVAWARRQRALALEGSLLTSQAYNAAELGQTQAAAALLDRARRSMARSDLLRGAAGARLSYVGALSAFQAGNVAVGDAAWAQLMAYQSNANRTGSHRLFEIGMVDGLVTSGRVTARVANELYAQTLREPLASDWAMSPVETMSAILLPNFPALERWMNVALDRNELELAAEIADRIRRLRFYSTLPMGGRLLALAWMLEAPKDALPERTVLQRQDLLTRFPRYAEASRRSLEVREELRRMPVLAADANAIKQQQKLWSELAAVSQAQELMLREIAIRRETSEFVMPPPLDCKQLREQLPPRQAVLAYLFTSNQQLHGFLISKSGCRHWRMDGASQLGKDVAELLKQFGQFDRNTTVDPSLIRSQEWRAAAASMWAALTNSSEFDSAGPLDEIVIVPDRFLWYLPFEALPTDPNETQSTLLSSVRVRYAPTVSLSVPDRRPASVSKETVVVVGRMFRPEDSTDAVEMASDLRKVLGDVTELTSLPAPASLLATLGKRTLVLHDAGDAGRGPYDWAPLQLDQDKPGNSLAQWLALPWGAPEQIAIPGFHTAAESSLRRGNSGDEIFLSACGLMASGCRTILLSRWRTGGQTTFDLTREFAQELPFASATNAWQRSVHLLQERDLRLDREPRVKAGDAEASVKAAHPFFWAGYLLIDTGALPPVDEARVDEAKVDVGKVDDPD